VFRYDSEITDFVDLFKNYMYLQNSQIYTDVSEQSLVSIFHDESFSKALVLMHQITRRQVPEHQTSNFSRIFIHAARQMLQTIK
jgi:hypothetical protein